MSHDIGDSWTSLGHVEAQVLQGRLVITTIALENRGVAEVCAAYAVSKLWAYELLARYRAEGEAAFEPRSRRPKATPNATPPAVTALILLIREQLAEKGLDAGADTIGWHLAHHHQVTVSRGQRLCPLAGP
jgi:hypothetical protein